MKKADKRGIRNDFEAIEKHEYKNNPQSILFLTWCPCDGSKIAFVSELKINDVALRSGWI